MIRTVIGLEPEDKRWLDETARDAHVPMAEIVRRAIRRLRDESKREEAPLDDLLRRTSGIWKRGDGLAYQRESREEWESPR